MSIKVPSTNGVGQFNNIIIDAKGGDKKVKGLEKKLNKLSEILNKVNKFLREHGKREYCNESESKEDNIMETVVREEMVEAEEKTFLIDFFKQPGRG